MLVLVLVLLVLLLGGEARIAVGTFFFLKATKPESFSRILDDSYGSGFFSKLFFGNFPFSLCDFVVSFILFYYLH